MMGFRPWLFVAVLAGCVSTGPDILADEETRAIVLEADDLASSLVGDMLLLVLPASTVRRASLGPSGVVMPVPMDAYLGLLEQASAVYDRTQELRLRVAASAATEEVRRLLEEALPSAPFKGAEK